MGSIDAAVTSGFQKRFVMLVWRVKFPRPSGNTKSSAPAWWDFDFPAMSADSNVFPIGTDRFPAALFVVSMRRVDPWVHSHPTQLQINILPSKCPLFWGPTQAARWTQRTCNCRSRRQCRIT